MVKITSHRASLTAGAKVLAATSGFSCPEGCHGLIGVMADGADGECTILTFPKEGSHKFAMEEIPRTAGSGEIAVNTRINPGAELIPGLPGFIPCGWPMRVGDPIDYTPDGAESTDVTVTYMAWAEAGDQLGQAVHWVRGVNYTYATTLTDAILVEVDEGLSRILYANAHGAGQTALQYRLKFKGADYTLPGSHNATDASEEPTMLYRINQKLESRQIRYGDQTGYFTGTAVGESYWGMV